MGIGPFEILVVLVVLLLVVGPERMPEVVRFLARTLREIRAAASEMREQVEQMTAAEEIRESTRAVRDTYQRADVRDAVAAAPADPTASDAKPATAPAPANGEGARDAGTRGQHGETAAADRDEPVNRE